MYKKCHWFTELLVPPSVDDGRTCARESRLQREIGPDSDEYHT